MIEIESNTNSLISRTYSERLNVLSQYGIEDKYGEVIDWAWSPTGDEIAFITRDDSENLIIINILNGDTIFQAVPQQLIRLSYAKYSPEIQVLLSALLLFSGIGMFTYNREVKTKILIIAIMVCMILVCYACSLIIYRLTLFTS